MARSRAIAVAQTCPVPADVDANLHEHLQLLAVAAQHRAQLVVFPELSLTGYELPPAASLAFTLDDPRLEPLHAAARAHDMVLVVGAPLRLDAQLYLGALILHPEHPPAVYTKHHLGAFTPDDHPSGRVPPSEASVFVPGTHNPPISFGDHIDAGAVAICADVGRPSHALAAARRGASVYLASMFVIPRHLDQEHATLASYAQRHRMVVAMANYGGPSGGLPSGGRSTLWSDHGRPLCQLPTTGAGVAIATESPEGWSTHAVML